MNNEFQKCLKLGQAIEKKAQQKLIEYYKNARYYTNAIIISTISSYQMIKHMRLNIVL